MSQAFAEATAHLEKMNDNMKLLGRSLTSVTTPKADWDQQVTNGFVDTENKMVLGISVRLAHLPMGRIGMDISARELLLSQGTLDLLAMESVAYGRAVTGGRPSAMPLLTMLDEAIVDVDEGSEVVFITLPGFAPALTPHLVMGRLLGLIDAAQAGDQPFAELAELHASIENDYAVMLNMVEQVVGAKELADVMMVQAAQ